jgi:hypothetical protein
MRSLTYVQPQQTLSCIGCHESREAAPATTKFPMAMARGPSKLTLGPCGSWPMRFDQLVQPVLDRSCVSCHKPGGKDVQAARLDLTGPRSYENLLNFGGKDLYNLVHERDRSLVGEMPARKSKLYALLTAEKGHAGVRLEEGDLQRLITWMDVYGHRQGHYDAAQEKALEQFREKLAPMLQAGP